MKKKKQYKIQTRMVKFFRPNEQVIMYSIETLKAFIQVESSSEKECVLQFENLAEKSRHNNQNKHRFYSFF